MNIIPNIICKPGFAFELNFVKSVMYIVCIETVIRIEFLSSELDNVKYLSRSVMIFLRKLMRLKARQHLEILSS